MTALQMEKELLAKWHALPNDKQQQALDFVQFLNSQTSPGLKPLQSALGLWANSQETLNDTEIEEARREMWGSFPGEDFY